MIDALSIVSLLAGVSVGAVLGEAALSKLLQIHRFALSLPFPPRMRMLAAILLVATELALAVSLISGFGHPWGAAGAVLLLSGFTLYVAAVVARGLQRSCLCFGDRATAITSTTVARNALLTLGAGLSAVIARHNVDIRP